MLHTDRQTHIYSEDISKTENKLRQWGDLLHKISTRIAVNFKTKLLRNFLMMAADLLTKSLMKKLCHMFNQDLKLASR